jgi:hypothetical protein
MRNVSDKSCRVIKTHILCSVADFRKSCRVRDNVEKYCRADGPQMAIWRMHIECWMPEATNAFRLCNTYCFSSVKSGCTNAPQFYVIRTLPVLFVPFLSTRTKFLQSALHSPQPSDIPLNVFFPWLILRSMNCLCSNMY